MVVINSNHTLGRHYNYYQVDRLADDPDIDFSKNTMIYVGGYLSSPFLPYNTGMGVEYKKLGYNVIMLDALMFNTIEYPRAARFLRVVGRHAAKMLAKMTSRGLNPKKLEIIGISLGGQTAGFIAKHYKDLTGVSVAKVVGLDAAGPCFRNLGPKDRLDKTDADFVINVASNIDGFGMATPIAHINYYVNGGEHQPGPLFWIYCPDVCSHTRAYEVWLSSLTHPDEFIAVKCDSVQQARDKDCFGRVPQVTNLLGPKADRNLQGIFYLSTTNTDPYYMGKRGLIKGNDYFISISAALNEDDVLKM
ncbi:lipase member H-like [Aricia agestis]|uniref:lipase member H-like n=1 Tax=Aricia agestis TaxID=91739 RepID=UPI001C2066FC|nr:lipase member H-like [Aricia agestis]